MVETDRTVGHMTAYPCAIGIDPACQEGDGAYIEDVNSIEDGSACAGCETPIPDNEGVECYCAVEEFGREHELYKWCTQDCFNRTHDECYPEPPPHLDE